MSQTFANEVGLTLENELRKFVTDAIKFCKRTARSYEPSKQLVAFVVCLEYTLGPLVDKLREDQEFRSLIRLLTGKSPEELFAGTELATTMLSPEELSTLEQQIAMSPLMQQAQELARRLVGHYR